MKQLVFTHVPNAGFAAFDVELSNGDWACVESSRLDAGPRRTAKPLDEGPTLVIVKLRLKWAIASLLQAIEVAGDAKESDRQWEILQKQLASILEARAVSNDTQKRAAAQRLLSALAVRSGVAATKLAFDQEVELGRKQVRHVSQGQGAADVTLLGLVPLMLEVSAATESLATAIGFGTNTKALLERKASARAACAATFSSAAYWLGWIVEYGCEGADRERAAALLEPLEKLANRYAVANRTQSEAMVGT